MIAASVQGLILGLILSIPVSPIFFLLISTSLEQGFKSALVLEIGIISSDILCIALIYFGLARFIAQPGFEMPMYLIGGILLILFGIITLFKKKKPVKIIKTVKNLKLPSMFLKGFALNITNPAVAIFWLGAVSIALTQFKNIPNAVASYFFCAVGTVLFFDILKAWLADYIRKWLNEKQIEMVAKSAGVAMGLFGVWLFYKGLHLYLS